MYSTNAVLGLVGSGLTVPVIIVRDAPSWGTEAVGHRVIGRRGILPSEGVRQYRAGTLTVACPTQASWRALRTVLDTGRLVDIVTGEDCPAIADATILVTRVSESRLADGGHVRMVDLEYQATDEYDIVLDDATWTWTAVIAAHADWQALAAAYGSYGGLLGKLTGSGVGW